MGLTERLNLSILDLEYLDDSQSIKLFRSYHSPYNDHIELS